MFCSVPLAFCRSPRRAVAITSPWDIRTSTARSRSPSWSSEKTSCAQRWRSSKYGPASRWNIRTMTPGNGRRRKVSTVALQIDRRQFVAQGSAALLHLATSPRSRAEVLPFRLPLPIPKVLSPVRSDNTTDYYEMVQREAWTEIIPGVPTRIWGYNGTFPGPTIRARRDRTTVVTHTNSLDIATVVHLHGGVTRPDSDGFPADILVPGAMRRYEYGNTGRAATLWYHDHNWRDTGRNLYMGLSGFYLLEGDSPVDEQLPHGPYDIPLMLQDRAFGPD